MPRLRFLLVFCTFLLHQRKEKYLNDFDELMGGKTKSLYHAPYTESSVKLAAVGNADLRSLQTKLVSIESSNNLWC